MWILCAIVQAQEVTGSTHKIAYWWSTLSLSTLRGCIFTKVNFSSECLVFKFFLNILEVCVCCFVCFYRFFLANENCARIVHWRDITKPWFWWYFSLAIISLKRQDFKNNRFAWTFTQRYENGNRKQWNVVAISCVILIDLIVADK